MILEKALSRAKLQLKEIENYEQKVNYLAQEIFSLSYSDLILDKDKELDNLALENFENAISKVKAYMPEAYILGYQYFHGVKFKVNSNVLIPRPETEQLVAMAAELANKHFNEALNFIDLGCGSGCIGISLAKKVTHASGVLLDISKEALLVAKENAQNILSKELTYIQSTAELYNPQKKLHLVLGNPPYIAPNDKGVSKSTDSFEPHIALYAEDKGLELIKNWMSHYVQYMEPQKSYMIFEIGHDQGEAVLKFSESLNVFKNVSIVKDLYGKDRFFLGEKAGDL